MKYNLTQLILLHPGHLIKKVGKTRTKIVKPRTINICTDCNIKIKTHIAVRVELNARILETLCLKCAVNKDL